MLEGHYCVGGKEMNQEDRILFSDLIKIEDDLKRNELTYQYFNEDKRLSSRVA